MERTIRVSDDVLRIRSNKSFLDVLGEMICKEKEILKTEIKNIEEEFQKWI